MSDPVSNAEIEDVLSSIRRLVSEEPSPLLRRKRVAEAAKERFVLTPALRVSEADAPEDGAESDELAAESQESPGNQDPAVDDTQTGDAIDVSGDEDAGAGDPDDAPDDVQAADPPAPGVWRSESDGPQEASANSPVREPVSMPRADGERLAAHRQTLEERIADLEAALEHAPDEWEPDGSEVSATDSKSTLAFDRAQPRPRDDHEAAEDAMGEVSDEADASEPDDEQEPVLQDEQPEAVQDDAGDANLAEEAEDLVADDAAEIGHQLPESDFEDVAQAADSADTFGESGQSWIDAEDEAALDQVASDPQHDETGEESEDSEDLFADDAVLDEDALRDMVAQLVRAELTGALGEQITRNVRRLVRREIQRALAVRELE